MKTKRIVNLFFLVVIVMTGLAMTNGGEWGFFGHRRINRMAVFTLPPEMMTLYKGNIDFITDHAVDPDKRRYATKHEAVRHYIDIDHWGTYPYDNVPRDWTATLMKFTDVYLVGENKDTVQIMGDKMVDFGEEYITVNDSSILSLTGGQIPEIERKAYRSFFAKNIMPIYYEDEWVIEGEKIEPILEILGIDYPCRKAIFKDQFSAYGISPYNLIAMHYKLVKAFENKDAKRILRLSTEFGHYIGDAHVPLHTTENYNGQLTNQDGIHGFWESRIPELFADKNWDYFVGKATYIDDPTDFYWDIVLTSHSYLDSVLLIEKELSVTFPEDQQYCYEERLERTIRVQCEAYAAAYNERMDGMVEARMRASIQAIGSAWYSAWIDAGQPDLNNLAKEDDTEEERKAQEQEEKLFKAGDIIGRNHGS